MEKHIHIFKQIGSGCMMIETDTLPCDCEYKCNCGVYFKVLTDRIGHRFLPEEFMSEKLGEIKQAEIDTIADVDLKLTPTPIGEVEGGK